MRLGVFYLVSSFEVIAVHHLSIVFSVSLRLDMENNNVLIFISCKFERSDAPGPFYASVASCTEIIRQRNIQTSTSTPYPDFLHPEHLLSMIFRDRTLQYASVELFRVALGLFSQFWSPKILTGDLFACFRAFTNYELSLE